MTGDDSLSTLLEELSALARTADTITLGDFMATLGARGFGPVLIVLSVFLILPVGMVPGVPGTVALMLGLIGLHMLVRRRQLWLPPRLERVTFSSNMLAGASDRLRPIANRLRPVLAPRLPLFIDSFPALALIGAILIATGGLILAVGFIPGLPFALSLHVLVLGVALTTRDGLVALLGYALVLPGAWAAWHVFG